MIISASKRIIRFKFGYTNEEALYAGKKGAECRGNEHEVIVTWSLSSGKQAVAFDQHEVFFAVCDTTQTKFTHTWRDENGHTFVFIAHAATLSLRSDTFLIANPDWRQYNLFVDGVSFFVMPKLSEIGVGLNAALVGDDSNAPPTVEHSGDYPHTGNAGDSEQEMSDRNANFGDESIRWQVVPL